MTDLAECTLGEIVSQDYRRAPVFNRYGLDFCCSGAITLREACEGGNLDMAAVLAELAATGGSPVPPSLNYNQWDPVFLIDYIVNTHHVFTRTNIPQLLFYTQKIAEVHGDRHPELIEIASLFTDLGRELTAHLQKEEEGMFPRFRDWFESSGYASPGSTETVSLLIHEGEREHEFVGSILHRIASLSSGYSVPSDACNTYQVAYRKLREFEEDIHQHVHLENNILFKKVRTIIKEIG